MLNKLRVSLFLAYNAVAKSNVKISTVTILVMTLLVINLLFLPSLLDNMDEATRLQAIDKQFGHIIVEPMEKGDVLQDVDSLQKKLFGFQEVVGVAPRYEMSADALFEDTIRPSLIFFVDPVEEVTVTDRHLDMVEGDFLSKTDTNKVVLGREASGTHGALFKRQSVGGARVGEKIGLTFLQQPPEYKIKGIFSTKLIAADWDMLLTMKDLEQLFGITNQATHLIIRLREHNTEEAFIKKAIESGFKEKFTITKLDQSLELTETFTILKGVVILVSLAISLVTLFILIYINAFNRKKLIGIIKSLGISKGTIIGSYIFQSLFYTLCGVILGLGVLYFVLVPYFSAHPFDFPFAFVSLSLDLPIMLVALLSLLLVAVIAAFLPVYQISKKQIIEMIRE